MAEDLDRLYKPKGPVSEALSSYYVQHVVQGAIDHAFRLGMTQSRPGSLAHPGEEKR
jgi:hypothetical protein